MTAQHKILPFQVVKKIHKGKEVIRPYDFNSANLWRILCPKSKYVTSSHILALQTLGVHVEIHESDQYKVWREGRA